MCKTLLIGCQYGSLTQENEKWKTLYYIRDIARVAGKPQVVNQIYLGSPERILEMAQGKTSLPNKLQVQEFGGLWLVHLIEKEIDIAGLIKEIVPPERESGKPSLGDYFL